MPPQPWPCTESRAGRTIVRLRPSTHIALYALLLLMPVSGWLMATTTPVRLPTIVFGLFALPYPLAPDLAIYGLARATHVALAMLLAALIVLHVAGALMHALVWRDQTLARMWRKPMRR